LDAQMAGGSRPVMLVMPIALGGGVLGVESVARAAADGHTLLTMETSALL
jgi:hypothetical protein